MPVSSQAWISSLGLFIAHIWQIIYALSRPQETYRSYQWWPDQFLGRSLILKEGHIMLCNTYDSISKWSDLIQWPENGCKKPANAVILNRVSLKHNFSRYMPGPFFWTFLQPRDWNTMKKALARFVQCMVCMRTWLYRHHIPIPTDLGTKLVRYGRMPDRSSELH